MAVILCLFVLTWIAGEFPSAAFSIDGLIQIDAKCSATKKYYFYGNEYKIVCNITASNDLIIEVADNYFWVICNETDDFNSLQKYFPNIWLKSNTSLYEMHVRNCVNLSNAEVISKIKIGNQSKDAWPKNFTLFGREVSLTDQQISYMRQVQTLEYSNTNIRSITSGDFSLLPNLTYLSIEECCVQINPGAFVGINNLEYLEVRYSTFTLLEHAFDDLKNLKKFVYEFNSILLIPENLINNNEMLGVISICNNIIQRKTLPENLFRNLTQVENLYLINNSLEHLPLYLFRDCTNLFDLKISHNTELKTLPESIFSSLTYLLFLYLDNNGLKKLPPELFRHCNRLIDLQLSENNLKSLPEGIFTNITQLTHLNLSYNCITYLPRNVFENQRELGLLDLSHNKLHNIGAALEIILLKHYYLGDLQLQYNNMDISFELLQQLQHKTGNRLKLSIAGNTLKCGSKYFDDLLHFPDIRLQSNSFLYQQQIKNCSTWSYAEVIPKMRIGSRSEDGLTQNITIFKIKVTRFTDAQISTLNLTEHLFLTNANVQCIESGDFNHLPEVKSLLREDCCVQFESKTLDGLLRFENFGLKGGNNITHGFVDPTLTSFWHHLNPISVISDKLFNVNKMLESIPIAFQMKTSPETLFGNVTYLSAVRLNNSGLEQLPPDLFHYCTNLTEIDLQNNNIKSLPEHLFTELIALTELNLRNNSITDLPRNIFENQTELRWLDLSYNKLHNIEAALEILLEHHKLQELELNYNAMEISIELLKVIQDSGKSLKQLSVEGNTLECTCDNLNELSKMPLNKQLVNMDEVLCKDGDGTLYKNVSIKSICDDSTFYIIVGVALVTPILILTTVIALYFKYETSVKVFLYSRGCCLRWITEEDVDRDKKYDVFIAFSHKDESFVMQELVPKLEGAPYHHKVCVHYRDWPVGVFIPSQIVESIENSRRTIVVLSPDLLNSHWAKFEFLTAHKNTFKDRIIRLIVLMYKDVGELGEIDRELNAYLQTNSYVKWGDPWFWQKLNYALPHTRTSTEEEGIELIEV